MFFAVIGPVQVPKQLTGAIAYIIKHKHSQKESRFLLPHNTSGLSPHGDKPLEAIQPLVTRAEANGPSSPERVRLLQPLLPRPQKRWLPTAHPRSQNPEPCPRETAVQDDYAETDPLVNMPRGLVLLIKYLFNIIHYSRRHQ